MPEIGLNWSRAAAISDWVIAEPENNPKNSFQRTSFFLHHSTSVGFLLQAVDIK
jgi:hypothetical protein